MRQIVLDTETTGIGHELGHRVIEIGCIELVSRKFTGNHYHVYLNPEREVDEGAFRVHGISNSFLKDKPLFKDIFDEFIRFISGAELIIHNATFDIGFLNSELERIQYPKRIEALCTVVDTLVLARKKHPGQRNTLDALCKRYDVNNANRQLHGALLDSELLAFVYLAMTGGQTHLFSDDSAETQQVTVKSQLTEEMLHSSSPIIYATKEELERHADFARFLIKKSGIDHEIV